MLVAVGAIAAGLAATVVFFMLRKEPAATTPRDQPAAASSDAGIDVAQLRTECADLEKTLFWKELKECADRLKTYDRALADKLWKKADDEAANEKKYKALQDYVQKKDFEKARVLVKRIEESVYTERAHKLLDEAEAAAKMP